MEDSMQGRKEHHEHEQQGGKKILETWREKEELWREIVELRLERGLKNLVFENKASLKGFGLWANMVIVNEDWPTSISQWFNSLPNSH